MAFDDFEQATQRDERGCIQPAIAKGGAEVSLKGDNDVARLLIELSGDRHAVTIFLQRRLKAAVMASPLSPSSKLGPGLIGAGLSQCPTPE